MKILVTGSKGFLGSWLAQDLRLAGHEVFGISRMDADLLNKDDCIRVMKKISPEIVVHSAGQVGGIQANKANNFGFLLNNMIMGANVISSAVECNVPNLLNFSSSCVYPPDAPQPFIESQVMTGSLEKTNEGYALAKISAQKLTEFASEQFGLNYRTLIPSNLYGPKDNFNPESSHMLAAILYKLRKAKYANLQEVEIWGDGTARREFTFVGDLSSWVASTVINILGSLPATLNVGCGKDYSIRDFYTIAAEILSYQGEFKYLLDKPSGMHQKLMDSSVASSLGWQAPTELPEGIRLTSNWMESNVESME
jgi:GDP-L-fucose synthase